MSHILGAARAEYAKLGQTLTLAELRGWPVDAGREEGRAS
jgi:hypothetical protein